MKKLVNSWHENDFCSKLLDELLEYKEDFPMSARQEKKFTYQLLEAATLSLLAIIGLQQSSRIENKLPGNTEILEYAKAAARRLSKAGDILKIVAKEKAMPVVFPSFLCNLFAYNTIRKYLGSNHQTRKSVNMSSGSRPIKYYSTPSSPIFVQL